MISQAMPTNNVGVEPESGFNIAEHAVAMSPIMLVITARAVDVRCVERLSLIREMIAPAGVINSALDDLVAQGHLAELVGDGSGRLAATERGRLHLAMALRAKVLPKSWADLRCLLIAHALGVTVEGGRRKGLAKPDGLRAAILDQAFELKLKGAMTTARLRSALAVVALERAFGNKVKASLGTGAGLSPKAGRLLAGQLSKAPRDFGTDGRLVAALAAEQVGAASIEFEALRTAVMIRFVGGSARLPATKVARAKVAVPTQSPAANDRVPVLSPPQLTPVPSQAKPAAQVPDASSRPAASNRPDLAGFADAVKAIAKLCGEGWSGSRKSYIADVWEGVKSRFTSWGLTEVEFKSMLAEAHRTGHIVLANADLKTKDNAARLAASAIVYKNTVWHFVRVED